MLEVRLVPKVANEGFLNAHIWAIPLSTQAALRLLFRATGPAQRRRLRNEEVRALVTAHVRRFGMPVFGTLADYRVDFKHAFLRLRLDR